MSSASSCEEGMLAPGTRWSWCPYHHHTVPRKGHLKSRWVLVLYCLPFGICSTLTHTLSLYLSLFLRYHLSACGVSCIQSLCTLNFVSPMTKASSGSARIMLSVEATLVLRAASSSCVMTWFPAYRGPGCGCVPKCHIPGFEALCCCMGGSGSEYLL